MTLCNFSAYLHYESGIFNVNVYINIKTEFKIVVYFINFLSLYALVQSLHAGVQMFLSSLFL